MEKIKEAENSGWRNGYSDLREWGFIENGVTVSNDTYFDTTPKRMIEIFKGSRNWEQINDSAYFIFKPGWNMLRKAGIDVDSIIKNDIIRDCDELYDYSNGYPKR